MNMAAQFKVLQRQTARELTCPVGLLRLTGGGSLLSRILKKTPYPPKKLIPLA
jgi:hypothetical protein